MKIPMIVGLMLALTTSALAAGDDFSREGGNRQGKDALEGKAPPALEVSDWMNTDGQSMNLKSLRGKVVVLDFWGTW
ncbi:MAG: hypothetical protein P1V35_09215 [Planctomycetota bacterium]|nr:hypothetical protein [Planctomycetota bacterium]